MYRIVADQISCQDFLLFVLFQQGFPLANALVQNVDGIRSSLETSARQDNGVAIAVGGISSLFNSFSVRVVIYLIVFAIIRFVRFPVSKVDRSIIDISHRFGLRFRCTVGRKQRVSYRPDIIHQRIFNKYLRISKEGVMFHTDTKGRAFGNDIIACFLQFVIPFPENTFLVCINHTLVFFFGHQSDVVCRSILDVTGGSQEEVAISTDIKRIVTGLVARSSRNGERLGVGIAARNLVVAFDADGIDGFVGHHDTDTACYRRSEI